jgi:hypothetical protein
VRASTRIGTGAVSAGPSAGATSCNVSACAGGAVRAYEVKGTSSLLRFSVVVFRPSRAVAVILADQRTAACSLCGLAAARAERSGRRAQYEKPAGGFFRAGGGRCRELIDRDAIGQRASARESCVTLSTCCLSPREQLLTAASVTWTGGFHVQNFRSRRARSAKRQY